MNSSRRRRLHLERSTSVGDIGSFSGGARAFDASSYMPHQNNKFPRYSPITGPSQNPNKSLTTMEPQSESQKIARPCIFFIGSPERVVPDRKEAEKQRKDDDVIGFGDFLKKCNLCKNELRADKDVYMYRDHPYCSSHCRDDQIALDGYRRKDFGLGNEDEKKSLGKNEKQFHMHQ